MNRLHSNSKENAGSANKQWVPKLTRRLYLYAYPAAIANLYYIKHIKRIIASAMIHLPS